MSMLFCQKQDDALSQSSASEEVHRDVNSDRAAVILELKGSNKMLITLYRKG